MHGKCEISGNTVTAWGLHQVRVCKRHKVVSRLTIESGDNATWVPLPTPKVIGKAESLLEKALVGIVKEMKASWKSMEKIAQDALEVSWDTLSQTMALVGLVDLVVQGKRFVRTWEMGWPESDRGIANEVVKEREREGQRGQAGRGSGGRG